MLNTKSFLGLGSPNEMKEIMFKIDFDLFLGIKLFYVKTKFTNQFLL